MGRLSRFRVALALSIGALAWATLSAPPAGAATTAGGPISKLLGPARPQPAAGRAKPNAGGVGPKADFNGDGFGDLAVGVPGEDIGSISNAGGVNVLYGSSSGLAAAGNQFWSQNSKGVIGVAETGDAFGTVVATGDFNDDGYSDLAIGAPLESVGSATDAGGVNVGASVTMGYFAQHQMEQLAGDRTVLEELVAHSPTTNIGPTSRPTRSSAKAGLRPS